MNEDVYIVGKDKAIASLVLGIISVLACFTGIGAIVGVVTGIIGLIFANKAKKVGYYGGLQTAGFVSSLVGLIISVISIIVTLVIVGTLFYYIDYATSYGMYTWY